MVRALISLSTYRIPRTCPRRARLLSQRPAKMDRMSVEAPTSRDALIGDLDDEQREAVLAARGPVCVLAGAGTGKTRTITRRIAHLVAAGHVAPHQVLAVTFTQRAAGEMRGRLRALDDGVGTGSVQAMTFHAAARRQLSYFWPRVVGDTGWQLLDTKFAVVAQAANRAGLSTSTDDVRDLAGEIEWAKASLISPEGYAAAVAQAGRDIPFDAAKIATVYAGYESLKARRDGMALLDFDDLLLHTAAAIENDDAVAQEFRDRYRCFVVDEYQDVTPLQQRVLDAWLGSRDDLTVVGDANQTIYSFTGATPRYLLDFSRRFPDAAVVRLERDYRSTPQVVSLANRVIAAARGRMAGSKLHLVGQRDPGPAPSFTEHPDEVAEAAAVAKKIKNLIESGTAASEIAVLTASTRSRRPTRRRSPRPVSRSRCAAAKASSAARRSAKRCSRCSAPPNATRPAGATRHSCARSSNRWDSPPNRRPAPGPANDGRRGRWPNSSTRRWRSGRRWTCAPCSPSCASAPTHATHRWCRASPWRRCTPPRDWSGMRCSWSAWPTARCPSPTRWRTAPTANRSRRNAGCSMSESPGPECIWRSAGRWQGTGRSAEPTAVALPQRHRPAIAQRRHPEPTSTTTRRHTPLPRLQQHVDHAAGDHAAPL